MSGVPDVLHEEGEYHSLADGLARAHAFEGSIRTYLHRRGDNACDQPAFLFLGDAIEGAPVMAKDCRTILGEEIEPHTQVYCGSCGHALTQTRFFISDFEELPPCSEN